MKLLRLCSVISLTILLTDRINSEGDECNCGEANEDVSRRIVNGDEVTANKYPWIASLVFLQEEDAEYNGCVGSVVSDRNVITSANCFFVEGRSLNVFEETFWILGMHEIGADDGEEFNTIEYFFHPNFTHYQSIDEADLVIATLDRKITFSNKVMPICLPSPGETYKGREAVVAGWGFDALEGGQQAEALMETKMTVIRTDKCRRRWYSKVGRKAKINDRWMVCAFRKDTDTCKGDSGAPLMVRSDQGYYELVGSNSFGFKCDSRVPAVFARISDPETLEWIYSYLADQEALMCPPREGEEKPDPEPEPEPGKGDHLPGHGPVHWHESNDESKNE